MSKRSLWSHHIMLTSFFLASLTPAISHDSRLKRTPPQCVEDCCPFQALQVPLTQFRRAPGSDPETQISRLSIRRFDHPKDDLKNHVHLIEVLNKWIANLPDHLKFQLAQMSGMLNLERGIAQLWPQDQELLSENTIIGIKFLIEDWFERVDQIRSDLTVLSLAQQIPEAPLSRETGLNLSPIQVIPMLKVITELIEDTTSITCEILNQVADDFQRWRELRAKSEEMHLTMANLTAAFFASFDKANPNDVSMVLHWVAFFPYIHNQIGSARRGSGGPGDNKTSPRLQFQNLETRMAQWSNQWKKVSTKAERKEFISPDKIHKLAQEARGIAAALKTSVQVDPRFWPAIPHLRLHVLLNDWVQREFHWALDRQESQENTGDRDVELESIDEAMLFQSLWPIIHNLCWQGLTLHFGVSFDFASGTALIAIQTRPAGHHRPEYTLSLWLILHAEEILKKRGGKIRLGSWEDLPYVEIRFPAQLSRIASESARLQASA